MKKRTFIIVVTVILLIVFIPILMVIIIDDKSDEDERMETIKIEQEDNAKESKKERENVIIEEKSPSYIPNNFSHIQGEIDTGYTIKDTYGNEYVWVPIESGELTRNINVSECIENEDFVNDFKNSVSKYKGFYIAKYESSIYSINDRNVCATMANVTPVSDVDYTTAYNVANNSYKEFGYSDVVTSMINSYAWDTVLEWIDKTKSDYSTSTDFGNYSETVKSTGTTTSDIVNNICDLSGNLQEWTTESYTGNDDTQSYKIVRGGSTNHEEPALKRINKENVSDYNIGFRMIMYKT